MTSRPRHARKKNPRRSQALLRAGLTVSAAGAVVAGAGSAAVAAEPSQVTAPLGALDTSAVHQPGETLGESAGQAADLSSGTVRDLPVDPMAPTGIGPLDNESGLQIADTPVGTEALTGLFPASDA